MIFGKTRFFSRTLPFFLAFLILLPGLTAHAQTTTFRDVPAAHFAFDAIAWASDPANGAFMVGDAGNQFHPARYLNKFEAAQIFAIAAGFRHSAGHLPEEEREVFSRSFETWRGFLEAMAGEYASWNRTADREIAFLLYLGIITPAEVQNFVVKAGTNETRPFLTREQAFAWSVRLVNEAEAAQAIGLPHQTPFRDDALITPALRRYLYHARELEFFRVPSGYVNPQASFTRAETAVLLYNALTTPGEPEIIAVGGPATITGTITAVIRDTHVIIQTASGTNTFSVAPNAVIMVDNTQRTAAFLREGMNVAALVDANRSIVSLVAGIPLQTERGTVIGTVTEIRITAHMSEVTIANDGGINSFRVRPEVFSPYAFRTGVMIRVDFYGNYATSIFI